MATQRLGFTLLQLIVILALFAIIAVAIAPKFLHLSNDDLKAQHQQYTQDLKQAIAQANRYWLANYTFAEPALLGNGGYLQIREQWIGFWAISGYPECIRDCTLNGNIKNIGGCDGAIAALMPNPKAFRQFYQSQTLPKNGGDCLFNHRENRNLKIRYSAVNGKVASCDDPKSCAVLTASATPGDFEPNQPSESPAQNQIDRD
ncbi:hypothetical protein VST7929_01422 [Vibrio stylophorae]|uniref:Type II secretion system protein n=1 Tax=Vibrio stylophorae TaxID=659351 RepID=A0ABM8ZTD6_9VIBR|nr:type II secretion system protein [Vibrio stylophorae]CAH0533552.1 hypothetical protein VST7929_01422 [Vibrio stylophorae]